MKSVVKETTLQMTVRDFARKGGTPAFNDTHFEDRMQVTRSESEGVFLFSSMNFALASGYKVSAIRRGVPALWNPP